MIWLWLEWLWGLLWPCWDWDLDWLKLMHAASIGISKMYEFTFGHQVAKRAQNYFFKPATYCIVCSLSSSNVSHEGVYIFKIDYTSETMSCPSSSMYKNWKKRIRRELKIGQKNDCFFVVLFLQDVLHYWQLLSQVEGYMQKINVVLVMALKSFSKSESSFLGLAARR